MKKSAFSLLELSVVLAILGILVAGVTQGVGMINASRLANARSNTVSSPIANMNGLVAWYETSLRDSLKGNEAVEGKQISEWYDISPNSIALKRNKLTRTASSAVVYRINAINKIPGIEFNGTAKISLANFYQGATSQATIFIVFRTNFNPSATQVTLFDADTSQNSASVGIKSNSVSLNAGSAVDTATATNPAAFGGGLSYVVAAYLNGATSGAYVNNVATLAGNGNINAGTNSLNGVTIGANKSTTSGFTGIISEVIIFNRPLKLQERKDVMGYLAKKYKISVLGF
jgi:prepilin-type N-terminal cleavage/methylation domain-containing protein